LHIGTMKSGTSYLQHILRRNRSVLAEAGVLVPRQRLVPAVADVLNRKAKKRAKEHRGTWSKVVDEIERWRGSSVVLSQEFMSAADESDARRLVATLAPRRVSVIITARDLVRILPSHWQTSIKQGQHWSLSEFVGLIQDESPEAPKKPARGFWKHHDLARMIEVWSKVIGIEQITVVTVPPAGSPPDLLWQRFASVLGIDPESCDITIDRKANFTLSHTATELLRRVNEQLGDSITPVDHRRVVNNFVANAVLRDDSSEQAGDDRARLSTVEHAWASERGQRMVTALEASGATVVGDLADLCASPPAGDLADGTDSRPLHESPDAAVTVVVALVQRLVAVEHGRAAAETQDPGPDGSPPSVVPDPGEYDDEDD